MKNEELEAEIARLEKEIRGLLRATRSLLDVVQEMAQGAALEYKPEQDWVDIVKEIFEKHRLEIVYGEEVLWPTEVRDVT